VLLPREQSPWNCGYFLGAIALQALTNFNEPTDLMGLQKRMGELLNRAVSPTQAVSAAAWLFLLGAIELDDNGSIVLCN
jgi:hypothetical protein